MHFWCTISKIVRVYGKSEGIEVDPDKIKAIVEMKPPRTEKEIQGFLGYNQIKMALEDMKKTSFITP